MKDKFLKEKQHLRGLFAGSCESAGGEEFRYFHSLNVAHLSVWLAKLIGINSEKRKVIFLATLFHDSAKHKRINEKGFLDGSHQFELENNLPRHEEESAELAVSFLSKQLNNQELLLIKETISGHDKPTTNLQKVLYDADELSEMGAVNLWKMFTYSSYKKRNLEDTVDYWFAVDRKRHLEKVKKLHFKQSRIEGKRRIKLCDLLMKELAKQIVEAHKGKIWAESDGVGKGSTFIVEFA